MQNENLEPVHVTTKTPKSRFDRNGDVEETNDGERISSVLFDYFYYITRKDWAASGRRLNTRHFDLDYVSYNLARKELVMIETECKGPKYGVWNTELIRSDFRSNSYKYFLQWELAQAKGARFYLIFHHHPSQFVSEFDSFETSFINQVLFWEVISMDGNKELKVLESKTSVEATRKWWLEHWSGADFLGKNGIDFLKQSGYGQGLKDDILRPRQESGVRAPASRSPQEPICEKVYIEDLPNHLRW